MSFTFEKNNEWHIVVSFLKLQLIKSVCLANFIKMRPTSKYACEIMHLEFVEGGGNMKYKIDAIFCNLQLVSMFNINQGLK